MVHFLHIFIYDLISLLHFLTLRYLDKMLFYLYFDIFFNKKTYLLLHYPRLFEFNFQTRRRDGRSQLAKAFVFLSAPHSADADKRKVHAFLTLPGMRGKRRYTYGGR